MPDLLVSESGVVDNFGSKISGSHSMPPSQVSVGLELAEASTSANSIISPSANSGIIYYTDCMLDNRIMSACQKHLSRVAEGKEIISVSLSPIRFGRNVVLPLKRGALSMFKQILVGLEHIDTEIVFFAEHDILYSDKHFAFVPPRDDRIFYQTNVYQLRASDGHVVFWEAKKVSQLCAYRELLIEHYRKRVELVEKNGFSMKMGYEPGTNRRKERVDDLESDTWWSEVPNVDIRHDRNLSKSKWSPADFRDKRNCVNWKEGSEIPGWGVTEGRFSEFLDEVSCGIIGPNGLPNTGSSQQ